MHYLFSSVLSRCCHRRGLFQLVLLVFLVFFSVAGSPTLCLKCCWQTTWSFSSFYAHWGRVFPTRADVFHKKGKWQVAFHFTLDSCRNYAAQTRLWNWNGNGGIEKRLKCKWGKNKLLAIPDRLAVRRFPLSPADPMINQTGRSHLDKCRKLAYSLPRFSYEFLPLPAFKQKNRTLRGVPERWWWAEMVEGLVLPGIFLLVGTFPRKLFRVPARPDSCASRPVRFLFHFKFFPIIGGLSPLPLIAICRHGQENSLENMHVQSGFLARICISSESAWIHPMYVHINQ